MQVSTKASTELGVDELAVEVAYDAMMAALKADRRAWPRDDNGYEAHVAKRRADLKRLRRDYNEDDLSRWRALADRMIEGRGLTIAKGGEAYNALVERVAEANLAAMEVFLRETDGEAEAEPRSKLVRNVKAARSNKARPGETLLDQYDAYTKWRSEPGRGRRRRSESLTQDRVAVELFAEFVGADRAIASLTKDDAKSFRAMLARFPSSRTKNRNLAGLGIAECIATAERDCLPTLSLTTQAKYLSIISPFYDWLVNDSAISVPVNIFSGLHHKLERGERRRPSFSAAQLNQLLASPLFDACDGDGGEHLVGDAKIRDWRFWIPLICMFTGSRITEVAQLRVDDIDVRDEAVLMLLAHDEGRGQYLKSKKGRLAALHPMLISAGFLSFWNEQRERADRDGNRQLFPQLAAGKRRLLGDHPSRWFRRYLSRVGIKNGADGYGPHSFRHTMADAMRSAGFMDVEYGQLVLGHANNSITAAYGSLPQGTPERLLEMLKAAIEAEPFKSVDFTKVTGRALSI